MAASWLLDLTVAGQVLRYATEAAVVAGDVYEPGLSDLTVELGAVSVGIEIIGAPPPGGWAVVASRWPIEGAPAQSNVTPLSDQASATHAQVSSASPVSAKHSNEASPGPVEARVGPKRSGKASVASTARGATKDDGANDTPKTSKKSGQFIPDEI